MQVNKEDIIRMAREADLDWHKHWNDDESNRLERFANLVAATEREACAELCDQRTSLYWMEFDKTACDSDRAAAIASEECADAIRARSKRDL